MDFIVALVLAVPTVIVVGMILYARRNDLVRFIRSPAEAYLGVRRDSPLSAVDPELHPQSESGDQPAVRHGRDRDSGASTLP
jgi:hypothetical protein